MKQIYLKCLLLGILSLLVIKAEAYDCKVGGIYYNLDKSAKTASVTYIDWHSDNNATAYKGAITIPSSFTYIGTTYNVTSIRNYAFWGCSDLTSVTIPNSVTSIGSGAFFECSSLNSIVVDGGNSVYDSRNNCNAIIETATNTLIAGCKSTAIPHSVTSIGREAFYGCSGLTSVTIPNSVTSIGSGAFGYCSSLNSIVVDGGNSVYDSRNNCNAIIETATNTLISGCKSTTFPNSVTSIRGYAFSGCSGLTSVTIPNNVTTIGNDAFSGCSGLTSVTLNSNSIVSSNRTSGISFFYIFGNQVKSYVIGKNVSSIGDYAFTNCSGLTSISIPNSVASIGNDAFYGCSGLTSISIPNSVTSIGRKAFYGCSGLTSVTIPNSVTSIGSGAFGYCSSLNSIVVDGGNSFYDSRNNCNAIIATVTNTLIAGCESTTIPNSVTSIGNYAFTDCIGLTSVAIPSSVTWIGEYAFYGCSGLTFVTIPNSVTRIGYNAFHGCSGLISSTTSTSISTGFYLEAGSSLSFYLEHNDERIAVMKSGHIKFTGLDPMQDYKMYGFGLGNGIYLSGKTKELIFTTSQPKVISAGNVIVAAESNLDDEETNVGFEWRRTDWSSDFASNQGNAYLYNGTMEGYIRNLYTEKLWKFRPYYTSNAGNTYYGEWVGIDPTNTSYFEPTVHTYANISVNGNSAEVKGYAMRGTDNVTSQGFAYWVQSSNVKERGDEKAAPVMAQSIPSNAKIVEASGQVMTATLSGLNYGTTYCFFAFVKTSEGETFYGEQQSFSIGEDPMGIGVIMMDASDAMPVTIVARYNMNGQQITTPQPGVNILRMSDGTVRKVLVK